MRIFTRRRLDFSGNSLRDETMANKLVKELTANEYIFLTLGGGLTLQKDDKVIFKSDLADRSVKELGSKVSVSDEFKFDFVDGDVSLDPTNTIAETAHGMSNDDPVRFATDGVLPTGLTEGRDYYVINANANDFQVSETIGGGAVQITSAAGGGTHTVYKMRARLQYGDYEIIRA